MNKLLRTSVWESGQTRTSAFYLDGSEIIEAILIVGISTSNNLFNYAFSITLSHGLFRCLLWSHIVCSGSRFEMKIENNFIICCTSRRGRYEIKRDETDWSEIAHYMSETWCVKREKMVNLLAERYSICECEERAIVFFVWQTFSFSIDYLLTFWLLLLSRMSKYYLAGSGPCLSVGPKYSEMCGKSE